MSFGSVVGLYNTKCVAKAVPATLVSTNIIHIVLSGRPVARAATLPLAVVAGVWLGMSGMVAVPTLAN